MNENTYIQNLIDRYMAAETTEDEERELQHYFVNHGEIPAEWEDVAIMLRGFEAEKTAKAQTASSQATRTVTSAPKKKTIIYRLAWMAAAAVALIMLGIWTLTGYQAEKITDSPEIAELVGDISLYNQMPCDNEDECAQMRFLMAVASIEDEELRNELMDLAVEFDLQELNKEADEYVEMMTN